MNFEINAVLSLSVGIGAVIGWIRLRKADPVFFPFILLLTAGFFTETVSIILMKKGYSNVLLYNIFSLSEAVIIVWQFKKWKFLGKKIMLYYLIQVLFLVSWVAEFILRGGFNQFISYFIVGYSTIIVYMAIGIINDVIFKEPTPLLLNPLFLICMGLIIYFTYMALIEIFWIYGLNRSSAFRISVYNIFAFINLFTNLLFAFATLWIPMKRQYILLS